MISLDEAWRKRVNLGQEVASACASKSNVVVCGIVGSVADKRCTHRSDLDICVISKTGKGRHVTSNTINGIVVEFDIISEAWIETLLSQEPSVKSLREASRIARMMPLYDPDNRIEEFTIRAHLLKPPWGLVSETLARCASVARTAPTFWHHERNELCDMLRSYVDSLVFLNLLLSPVRYHKPKWVFDDLVQINRLPLLKLLKRVYHIPDYPSYNDSRIQENRRFLDFISMKVNCPGVADTLKAGFTRIHPEFNYACRTLEDAEDLFNASHEQASVYVATMAGRLGFTHFNQVLQHNYSNSDGHNDDLEPKSVRTQYLDATHCNAHDEGIVSYFLENYPVEMQETLPVIADMYKMRT